MKSGVIAVGFSPAFVTIPAATMARGTPFHDDILTAHGLSTFQAVR